MARPPRRGVAADRPAARHGADAATLPELHPARTLLNRLWPLLFSTLGAGVSAIFLPQVAGVATGFAIIWALAWRRQERAVTAIEERDGVRFYVDQTSPLSRSGSSARPGSAGTSWRWTRG